MKLLQPIILLIFVQFRIYSRESKHSILRKKSYECVIFSYKILMILKNEPSLSSECANKVEGTPERPRLCVFRSNKHIYVQVIDDTKMHTLASASTMQKPISEEFDFSTGPTIQYPLYYSVERGS